MSAEPEFPRSPLKKLTAIGMGLFAALLIGLGALWYYGLTALDSDLEKLRASGMPASASDMNAFYVVPEGVTDTTDLWVRAIATVQSAKFAERGINLPIVGTGKSPIPLPGEPWPELEEARKLFAEAMPEMQVIRAAAAARGQVRFPIDLSAGIHTLLTHTQYSRSLARVFSLDAYVAAHDGEWSRALDDIQGMISLSDAMRGEPLLISQLVRIAIYHMACEQAVRILPRSPWSDEELKSLAVAIQGANFKNDLIHAVEGERATCVSALDEHPLGPLRQANTRQVLRFFEKAIDGFSGPWPEVLKRQRELGDEMVAIRQGGVVNLAHMYGVMQLFPAMRQASIAGARANSRQHCVTIAIAAERFRLKHRRPPETLEEIEGFIREMVPSETEVPLLDPFDGQPLRYKVEEKQILIYSVGDDNADDGGDVIYQESTDGEAARPPRDIGYAMERRKP